MKQSSWSPADLNRQERVVGRIASRAEVNRRQLRAVWQRGVSQLATLSAPLAIVGCFFGGVVVGSPVARLITKAAPSGVDTRQVLLPALVRGVLLTLLTYTRWYAEREERTAGEVRSNRERQGAGSDAQQLGRNDAPPDAQARQVPPRAQLPARPLDEPADQLEHGAGAGWHGN